MDNGNLPLVKAEGVRVPPHPLDGEWYVHISGETYGPYTGRKVKELVAEGRMQASTDVARLGSDVWTAASEDRALSSLFPKEAQPASAATGGAVAGAGATIVQVNNSLLPSGAALIGDDGVLSPKSAGLAAILSFLIVGLGQIYNGQVGKGILMFVGCVLLWFVFLGWIVTIWSCIDAYQTAKAANLKFMRRIQGSPA